MIRVASGLMVQYECQSCRARTVRCESCKRFARGRRRKRNKFAAKRLFFLFLGVANLAGLTAFFNRMGAGHDAANPRNPCLAT